MYVYLYMDREKSGIQNKELTVINRVVGLGKIGMWMQKQGFSLFYLYTVTLIEFFTSFQSFILSIF